MAHESVWLFTRDDTRLHEFIDWVDGWAVTRGGTLAALFISLFLFGWYGLPEFPHLIGGWLFLLTPVWIPIAAIATWWYVWVWYVRALFIAGKSPILLEVRIPSEITKSPRAMEAFFTNLWIRQSETTFIDKYWSGGVRPWFSFELVSLGGQVHYYIWCWNNYKNLIESNLYAQYPDLEIFEVQDYATGFHYDPEKHEIFASDYRIENHIKKWHDPSINAYPIRTYVDFELDKDPKEEFKVDPYAQVIETLSMLGPEEQAWIQIVIRSHISTSEWRTIVEKEVDKIRAEASVLKELPEGFDPEGRPPQPRPTWKHSEMMRSMERNLGKLPFDFAGRAIYIAPRGKMNGVHYTAVRWIWRPFANPNYGALFRPKRYHNAFDYPWQDFRGIRWESETRRALDAFRRRMFFHAPQVTTHNTQSVEVLATLWHFPSSSVRSPGLQRIPSTKGSPPPNLPM